MDAGRFEHFGINTSRVENGRVVTVDGNAKLRAMLGFVRRTPVRDAMRLLRMIRLIRAEEANRYLDGPGFAKLAARWGDPSLDRLFSPYLLRNIVRTMTVRMNGAEPDEVFLGTFGTNLGMVLDRFEQLTAGFEPTFRKFSGRIDTRMQTTVRRVLADGGRTGGVEVADADGTVHEHVADLVVVALPGPAAADLLQPLNADLARALREIRYHPVAVAMAEYAEPVFTEQVRALVFGPDASVSNAGAYGMHDRQIVRYTFSGRAARPMLHADPAITTLVERGEAALDRYIRVSATARQHITGAVWPTGLCAYGPRHGDRLARVARERDRLSNLLLTGDYICGASIEACFRAAEAGTAKWTTAESSTSR